MNIARQLKIALISGGKSREAEVSRSSAAGVEAALRTRYTSVVNLELDSTLAPRLQAFDPDVVFPVLHGPPGEDGTLQGFLDILGLPYVGSGVLASAAAMDKTLAKAIFADADLPLAQQVVIDREQSGATAVEQITRVLGDYVVVKPATQGSALGVSLVDNENALAGALEKALGFDHKVLIEERLDGREITVGVIDTDEGTRAFPVILIDTPEDSWYDYDHRYTAGLSEHIMPAPLPPEQLDRLQQIAVAAHQALGCRDLSRADFIVMSESSEVLLEVNTLPGMTPTSLYPDGAAGFGLDFPALVSYLVQRAHARGPRFQG